MKTSHRSSPHLLLRGWARFALGALGALGAATGAGRPARAAPPSEGIVNLHAELTVDPDGLADVEETILVWAAGARVRSGIERDIPTGSAAGRTVTEPAVELDGLAVTRDGHPETFRVERRHGAARVRLGDEATPLTIGTHVYVITYRLRWQVEPGAEHDRVVWHVLGDGRALPVDQASLVVMLPEAAASRIDGMTAIVSRPAAPVADAGVVASRRGAAAVFTTSRALAPDESLTAIVSWPAGIIRQHQPGAGARAVRALAAGPLLGAAGVLVLLQVILLAIRGARGGGHVLTACGLVAIVADSAGARVAVAALALGVWLLVAVGRGTLQARVKLLSPEGQRRFGARARRRARAGAALASLAAAGSLAALITCAWLTSLATAAVLAATIVAGAARAGLRPAARAAARS